MMLRIKPMEQNKLNAARQFTTEKTLGCANVSLNSSRAETVWSWDGGHPGLTVWNFLNYTSIESVHKVRKKTFVFYYVAVICTTTGKTEQIRVCVIHYDQSAWTAS